MKEKKSKDKKTGNPLIIPVIALVVSIISATIVIVRLIFTILECLGKI